MQLIYRIYGWLLFLFPSAYREEYGDELQAVFNLSGDDALDGGVLEVAGVVSRELQGLPKAIIYEHLRERVNAAGTARLCEALAMSGGAPLLLVVSTAEVYGTAVAPRLRLETDAVAPGSPYAASKLGAEVAAQETARRTGLRVIVARPFPHPGAGQDTRFVVPAFARRIHDAMAGGRRQVMVGNLEPVRDFLHVDDVVDAYVAMVERGRPGTVYNVASGSGTTIRGVFARLKAVIGADVTAVVDPALARSADIPHLVGNVAYSLSPALHPRRVRSPPRRQTSNLPTPPSAPATFWPTALLG